MRTIKIVTVAVAALFLLMIFQNSYSQSLAMAEAKELKSTQPAAEVSSSEEPEDFVSDSGPIQSVPGPPEELLSGSITQPREQFAITESLLMVVAFVVLMLVMIFMIPLLIVLSPLIGVFLILMMPVNFLFILLIMVLPVILASFADVSSYEIPGAIQGILNDIGSKGTLTEITFAYLKNLWGVVIHLPEIVRLTGDLNTEDYANLIGRFGSLVLNYPSNLRALPNKILHNLFPTVNALPAWLRQSPVLLQVFPLLMYAVIVLFILVPVVLLLVLVVGLVLTFGFLPLMLVLGSLPFLFFAVVLLALAGFVVFSVGAFVLFAFATVLFAGISLVAIFLSVSVALLAMVIVFIVGFFIGVSAAIPYIGILGGLAFAFFCLICMIFIIPLVEFFVFFAMSISTLLFVLLSVLIFPVGTLVVAPLLVIGFIIYLVGAIILGGFAEFMAVINLILGLIAALFSIVGLGIVGLGIIPMLIALGFNIVTFTILAIGIIGLGIIVAIPVILAGGIGFTLGALNLLAILAVLGVVGAMLFLVIGIPLLISLFILALIFSIPLALLALAAGAVAIPILGGIIAILLLPLMLPVGPQAVNSYPSTFRLFLSLAENSVSIPLGLAALPLSTCLSIFRGLPGSLRPVIYHAADFALTPFILSMRALPLTGTFIVLTILWIVGAILAAMFSPFILIAPVFIVLAFFAQGLIDGESAIDTDEIKKSIDNLPENVGEVDRVIKRMAEMLSESATTDIGGLLDSLVGVDWLIATQNLTYTLPEAMQAVGSAVPAVINSCPIIIQTLIDSGLKLTIAVFEMLSDTLVAQIRNIFALIWALPEVAVLIPQLLEILSIITINLPALIQGFIPAAVDTFEQTTTSLPELLPSIVLSTMGLNAIVLQFARGVWRISMRVSDIIIQTLWYLILLLPTTVFDFDEFVTPWFGPRFLSVVGVAIGAIPAACIGGISALLSLVISVFLTIGMCCYLPAMVLMQIFTLVVDAIRFSIMPCTAALDVLNACLLFFTVCGSIIDAIIQYPISQEIVNVITGCTGIVNSILTPINEILTMIGGLISALSLLADWILPIFFLILVGFALFPLAGIAAAFIILAFVYFMFYLIQIFVGTLLMACSGVFQSVVMVPILALCEPVPVISTLLGYLNTLTGFYAFFIPPNFIEIITQLIPLSVNLLAACPAIVFMPISLMQTFVGTASRAVEALPSVPAYLGRLTDRIIFSFCAECLAAISFVIDLIVAVILSCFAVTTGMLGELLSLDILTNAPQIAILVLALIFVIFAWIIDLCGVMCLRTPDMINEYAYSILKSMAMMPILSAIVPGMAAAPAAMQPEVVSAGLSKLAIIVVLSPLAFLGAFVTLIYNLFKEVFVWLYGTAPSLFLLPLDLLRRSLDFINRVFSGIGSTLEGAAGSMEGQLVPYVD